MRRLFKVFELLFLCLIGPSSFAAVSPIDFGINEAQSAEQRYWVLYNTHVEALKSNEIVDYSGMKTIDIVIPEDAKSIPLGNFSDFNGVEIIVKNTAKDFCLFSLHNDVKEIAISQKDIDGKHLCDIKELATGTKLLVLEDKTPWVNERKGFNHSVYRKDILILKSGVAQNRAIMPYGVETVSNPVCYYANVDNSQKRIQNIVFKRTDDCTYKTFLVQVEYQNNVIFENLETDTPANKELYGDHIINVLNCTNVTFRNVIINGVYSPNDSWGYGIGMNNVYNVKCFNVSGTGTVFGCNNINVSYLKNCNISRYDIHCYGRDVRMDKCTFWGGGFSVSSVFGDIIYKKCTFKGYFPVGIRSEYSCNVPYNLSMKDCIYYVTKEANFVIYTGKTDYQTIRRSELIEKCLPNVKINGLKIIANKDVRTACLFFVGYLDKDYRFGCLKDIVVKNVEMGEGNGFMICTTPIKLREKATIIFRKKGETGVRMQTSIIENNKTIF